MKYLVILTITLTSFILEAKQDTKHSVKLGNASIAFNNNSGQLVDNVNGLATPDGITANAQDTSAIVFSYDYHFNANWALHLAAGIPPEVELQAAGTGEAMGIVGTAKSIIPGAVLLYRSDLTNQINVYFGLGLNYSTFADSKVSDQYTASFHGTSSRVELEDGFGEIIKFGMEYNLSKDWFIDFSLCQDL